MCHHYAKVIISLLLVLVKSSTAFPTDHPLTGPTQVQGRGRGRVAMVTTDGDSALAKYENTTIIFGHQHVLFSAPTRAPHPITPDALIAPSKNSRTERRNEIPEIETSSEEKDFFEEYSYEVAEDERMRQELCPGTGRGRQQLLYDVKEKKCAKVGEKAHCGINMDFRYDPSVDNSTLYGYCECEFKKSRTPLVYHPESNACYFIYQRAYCATKEWLIFNKEGAPVCEKRACQKSSSRRSKLLTEILEVPLNGTGPCVPLNQHTKYCSEAEETVNFHDNELVPRCGIQRLVPAPRIISPIRQLRCRPGSYINIVGKCQPAWEW